MVFNCLQCLLLGLFYPKLHLQVILLKETYRVVYFSNLCMWETIFVKPPTKRYSSRIQSQGGIFLQSLLPVLWLANTVLQIFKTRHYSQDTWNLKKIPALLPFTWLNAWCHRRIFASMTLLSFLVPPPCFPKRICVLSSYSTCFNMQRWFHWRWVPTSTGLSR